jgi:formylglycine-generating enzyme required for sulfatase activity
MKRKQVSSVIFAAVLCLSSTVFAVCPSMDATGDCRVDFADFAKFAEQWLTEGIPDPNGIVWVSINDPGVPGYETFNGQMSKYETTNAQYRQFLNAALATGDITVSGGIVYGANGSNSGADFVGQVYYNLAGPGYADNGATNGGAARINYSYGGGVFSVDGGFENHPVTYVSWYGATAFCNYYGYRLPTEWEWQAVADYDGSYTYGCGTSINNSITNYYGSTHPDGTTAVGAFGAYGYGMCDMTGNVWEWTSSIYSGISRAIRDGGWHSYDYYCTVSNRGYGDPDFTGLQGGFRVCR